MHYKFISITHIKTLALYGMMGMSVLVLGMFIGDSIVRAQTASAQTVDETTISSTGSQSDSGQATTTATTTEPVATTTANTTVSTSSPQVDIQALQNRVTVLEQKVATLEEHLRMHMNMLHMGTTSTSSGQATTTPGTMGSTSSPQATVGNISPSGISLMSGSSVDFGGRGFGTEENVTVMLNGQTVTTAHADGGGNFSTGSIRVPSTSGTHTYAFTGERTDITASATVTVISQ